MITMDELLERCGIPLVRLMGTVLLLVKGGLVVPEVRQWQPEDRAELRRQLRLRPWQYGVLLRLPPSRMLQALYFFRAPEVLRVLLEFRLSNDGHKYRFEQRQVQPLGHAEPEGA
jgi:hypothetical protein